MATFSCPIRTALYKAAKALLEHPQVAAARLPFTAPNDDNFYETPMDAFDREVTPNVEVTLDSPIDYPRAIIDFQDMLEVLDNPDKMQARIVINDKPVTVSYKVTESGAFTETVAFGPGGSYAHLSGVINNQKKNLGLTDAQIASDISNALQGNPLSKQDEAYEKFVARMTWLLFGTESGRNPATLLTAPMMLDLIQNNNMTFANFLNDDNYDVADPSKGGGLFPMSFKGAVPASRSLYPGNRYAGPAGSAEEMAEMASRETALLRLWSDAKGVPPNQAGPALAELARKTYGVPLQ
jgi:hypothetical protein